MMNTIDKLKLQNKRLIVNPKINGKKIVSYGIILNSLKSNRWLLVQRKHTSDILLIMKGLYRISHLPLLVKNITEIESKHLKNCINGGINVFEKLYLEEFYLEKESLNYSKIRFAESINIINTLLNNIDFTCNQLSWNWPKGRPNKQNFETNFESAIREFQEEVEINIPIPLYISDYYVTEYIKTLTGKYLESKYWIYIINDEFDITKPDNHNEIENRAWFTSTECELLINNKILFQSVKYDVEKLNII